MVLLRRDFFEAYSLLRISRRVSLTIIAGGCLLFESVASLWLIDKSVSLISTPTSLPTSSTIWFVSSSRLTGIPLISRHSLREYCSCSFGMSLILMISLVEAFIKFSNCYRLAPWAKQASRRQETAVLPAGGPPSLRSLTRGCSDAFGFR